MSRHFKSSAFGQRLVKPSKPTKLKYFNQLKDYEAEFLTRCFGIFKGPKEIDCRIDNATGTLAVNFVCGWLGDQRVSFVSDLVDDATRLFGDKTGRVFKETELVRFINGQEYKAALI